MNVSTANNAWMGVGFGTGYALASSIPAFEENEIAKLLFGMMGGMPIGWRKKQAKKLMTEGRISPKASKSNLVQKIYNNLEKDYRSKHLLDFCYLLLF